MAKIDWQELDPPERRRTYYFPNRLPVTFRDVVRVEVRPSGKHRIETKTGDKAFVSPTWDYMEICTDSWAF